ncbi:hypothetical protein OE88DRAFT_1661518 [Heliocybe sulcata]|uniref:Senescence domain-containing protein n=1 Tax=Heliocybe sulcata TaxID=5364 RepID=A0A5C3N886_9AGAM|nr:hypothetical protein OE88DRAFT_1661518 [Heliocybe sulcata]
MGTVQPEAYLLLSLPNATLTTANGRTYSGVLNLECVTVSPQNATSSDSDVYLVVRLDEFETALDPSKPISLNVGSDGTRTYTFHDSTVPSVSGTQDLALRLSSKAAAPDAETFDSILSRYADNFYTSGNQGSVSAPPANRGSAIQVDQKDEDLRGHLVLVDEDNGQVLGALDTKLNVHEDPLLQEKGQEGQPVVIEVPEDEDLDALGAHEVFVRAIPPGEHNWMTKGASYVSQAITAGTSLLLTGVTSASNYYVTHSAPASATSSGDNAASSSSKDGTVPPGSSKSIPLALLTSERTRKGLAQVHAVSGQAVKVSQKTVSVVEGLVKKVVGSSSATPASPGSSSSSAKPPLPPRKIDTAPSVYGSAPPPYQPYQPSFTSSPSLAPSEKPPLPARRSPPAPPAPASVVIPTTDEPTTPQKLTTRDRLALSADLILSTLDDSTKKIFDVGSESMAKVAGHKYGPEAGHNTRLLMHTGRNVALVYIDMRGFGRRALVKKAGKEFVKSRVRSKKAEVAKT